MVRVADGLMMVREWHLDDRRRIHFRALFRTRVVVFASAQRHAGITAQVLDFLIGTKPAFDGAPPRAAGGCAASMAASYRPREVPFFQLSALWR